MNRLKNIVFCCDFGQEIGFGHLSRMSAFATYVREECSTTLVTTSDVSAAKKLVDSFDDVLTIQDWNTTSVDAYCALKDVVVLDGYHFGIELQQRLKAEGVSLICVDDHAVGTYAADAVLNHAPCIDMSNVVCPNGQVLGGTEYTLVRDLFYSSVTPLPAIQNQNQNHKPRIVVFFGGGEGAELSRKISEALIVELNVEVVVVGNHPDEQNELNSESKEFQGVISYAGNLDAFDMIQEIDAADLVCCSSSTMAIEVACRATPCVVGYFVDNQRHIYDGLCKLEISRGIGDLSTTPIRTVVELVERALTDEHWQTHSSEISRSHYDGSSIARLRNVVRSL